MKETSDTAKSLKKPEDIFLSYNEIIKDTDSITSIETYKDVMEYLIHSDHSDTNSSDSSIISNFSRSSGTDEQNPSLFYYATKNFISKRGDRYKKKYHTVGCEGNLNRNAQFLIKQEKQTPKIEAKIKSIRNSVWKPEGKGVPKISSIKMSHKKAWDIGKDGCNGLVIESLLENYNKKRLNYMVLDGTNIDNFLIVYSHNYQDTVKGVDSFVLHDFSFYDLQNAHFFYDIKSVHIFISTKNKNKTIILRNLNDHFFDAILICMNEIIIHLKIEALKNEIARKEQLKRRKTKEDFNNTIYYVKSAKNKNNLYINNIKDVLNSKKKKGTLESIIEEPRKQFLQDVLPPCNEIIQNNLCLKEHQHYTFRNSCSVKSDDSCFNCFSDILNKEKSELGKKSIKCENSDYNDNTSHTSESNEYSV